MHAGENNTHLPYGKLVAGSFWVAWITVIFSGDCIVQPSVSSYETTFNLLVVATFGMGVAMIASALVPEMSWNIITRIKSMVGIGIACMISILIVGFEALFPAPLFFIAAFLAGASVGIYTLRCAIILVETEIRIASVGLCICGISGVLIYTLFSSMALFYPTIIVLVLCSILPLLGTLISFIEDNTQETDLMHDKASERLTPAFWRVVAFMAFIVFALSLIRGFYPRLIDPMQFARSRFDAAMLLLFFMATISVVEVTRKHGYNFSKLFYSLFMVSVALIFPVVIFGTFSSMSGSFATAAKGVLLLASWSFLNLWSYKTGMSAIRVFGFGYGTIMIASFLGYAAGGFSGQVFPEAYGTLFESIMLLVCVLISVFLLRVGDLEMIITPTSEMVESAEFGNDDYISDFANDVEMKELPVQQHVSENLNDTVTDNDNVQSSDISTDSDRNAGETKGSNKKIGKFMLSCKMIAAEYDLTPRETDVFILLAKHMEVKAIAEELFVSFNTARTHVRHIYSKLEVHNRRELDDLIDSYKN